MSKPTLITLHSPGFIGDRADVEFVFSDGIGERSQHSWYRATIDQDRLFRILSDAGVLEKEEIQ